VSCKLDGVIYFVLEKEWCETVKFLISLFHQAEVAKEC